MWGCFAGKARKSTPQLPSATATSNEPSLICDKIRVEFKEKTMFTAIAPLALIAMLMRMLMRIPCRAWAANYQG